MRRPASTLAAVPKWDSSATASRTAPAAYSSSTVDTAPTPTAVAVRGSRDLALPGDPEPTAIPRPPPTSATTMPPVNARSRPGCASEVEASTAVTVASTPYTPAITTTTR